MPPRLNVPTYRDLVKRCNFHKADWKRFCFLTVKSVERLPPPDTTKIEKAYQELYESPLSTAKQCITLGRGKNYVPCRDIECKALYRSFLRAPMETGSDRAASSILHASTIRSRSDGKKLSIPSTSRTPAARRGAPSTHFKKRPLPALKYSNGRNCLTSVLAYHPFHHVPYQPVDEIFLSSLIQPKNNTAIQYLYLWFFNQTLGHSHVQWRS